MVPKFTSVCQFKMCIWSVILLNVWLLYSSTIVCGGEVTVSNSSLSGYGYEVLSAKLEYLQYKLIEMDYTLKKDRESTNQKLSHQATLIEGLLFSLNYLSQTLGHNVTTLQTQSNKILSQQAACASHDQMRKEIEAIAFKQSKIGQTSSSAVGLGHLGNAFRSCKEEPTKRSGKYFIKPIMSNERFEGYCEQTQFDGGWLVVQLRFDGSVDFNRNWNEYRDGFGSIDGEFWIGLEHLHQITSERPHELIVEVKLFNGSYAYARYTEFEIGSEKEQYQLKKVGAYSGTATDSLKYHKHKKFSTIDRNNVSGAGCGYAYEGGWWQNNCHWSNLNGRYSSGVDSKYIIWYNYPKSYASMAYTRMMIREVS